VLDHYLLPPQPLELLAMEATKLRKGIIRKHATLRRLDLEERSAHSGMPLEISLTKSLIEEAELPLLIRREEQPMERHSRAHWMDYEIAYGISCGWVMAG